MTGVRGKGRVHVIGAGLAVMTYLERLGAQDRLAGPAKADLAFMDLRDGTRWRLRPNDGPLAWWVFAKGRRVPGAKAADYLPLASLLWRHPGKRIDQVLKPQGVLWERLLEPFFLAALNTAAVDGSADLAGAVVRETLARGGQACRPRIAHPTLAAAFVEPALAYLQAKGARAGFQRRAGPTRAWRNGSAGGSSLAGAGAAAGAERARCVPRHRQRPFHRTGPRASC